MRKRLLIYALPVPLVAAAAVAVAMTTSAQADPAAAALEETIDEILDDERLDGSQASVMVADPATGDTLYEHASDARQLPASNVKLLTSAAASELLGGDYTFATDVSADGNVDGASLDGDLYLRGTGDPTMLAEDYESLAAQVADSGVTSVSGDLVADDTRFDDSRLGRSWPWDNEMDYYQPQISPLTLAPDTDYDAGTVFVTVTPADSPGEAPSVTLSPDNDYVTVDNSATTVDAGEDNTLGITREHGNNTFVISGDIPTDAEEANSWTTVWEPTGYATAVFADALEAEGVSVAGDVRLGEAVPDDAEALASHESMTLDEMMIPFMKLSNNGHAEALTKTIGYEDSGDGSWQAGLSAIGDFLDGMGVDGSALEQADGSGLSRMNHIPADEFISVLTQARDASWFDAWHESLPIACEEERFVGGTLVDRMCGTPAESNVHAKTGTLTGASGLSGYVTDADGRELVFSIMINNHLADTVKDIEDEIAIALASFSAEEAAAPMPQYSPPDYVGGDLECTWVKPATC